MPKITMPAMTKFLTPKAPLHQAAMRTTGGIGEMISGIPGAEFMGPASNLYAAYKGIKGFQEGGVKGALRAVIPFGKSIFGGGKGGAEGKAITAAITPMFKSIDSMMTDLAGASRQSGRVAMVGRNRMSIGSLMNELEGIRGSLSNIPSKGAAYDIISKAGSGISRISKMLQSGGGRGGGGRASLPLPEQGNIPLQPGTDFPGQGLGVGGDIPVVGFQAGAVGTTKTPAVRASVSARNTDINKLVRILGG